MVALSERNNNVAATTKMAISIPTLLFDQIKGLARQFNISRSRFVEIAIENFLKSYQNQALYNEISKHYEVQRALDEEAGSLSRDLITSPRPGREQVTVSQGDVFWVALDESNGTEVGHPHVVIQDNVFNRSRINTVVVCALTSNIKRAKAPGNVLLEEGEANLPRQSVVIVSQVSTVDKTQLGEYIGTLTKGRIDQVLAGMQFLQLMIEHHEIRVKKY